MQSRLLLKVSGIVTFVAGTFGLWYGFAMSFLVPGIPEEPYFKRDRVLLGNLPLLGSVLALAAAGWMSSVLFLSRRSLLREQSLIAYVGPRVLGFCTS
jgi:hypothetical protein